uniref:Zinc finger mynd domain-containing protein 10-like n=1 Tax=Tetraselmis sp. GSL018 TaxID=582737 RepID=A0A061SCF1_9CHLO|eukprot:CAMPEP_0177585880 /NCGR_PEP_ID=MMETSP0419_2-20121207/4753_1 /TAXON_ID=582737 /ORGANISM="Tetraselmis sp., Strain GSL018" /LENGTH=640 /DNA_ID=CAMNT_0019075691 /DNA_START=381 /DNA_END=2303 /DNA_ORIENTATION=-
MEQLISRAHLQSEPDPSSVLLSASEGERIVEQLKEFSIDEVGSNAWFQQRDWIEQLNIQAHHNAQTHSDEFVMEALVSFDKITVLIHELLVIEVWKTKILPHIKHRLANEVDSIISYPVLYHEASVTNLLEVSLFHSNAVEAANEDALLELVDWSHRKAMYLNNDAHSFSDSPARTAKEWMERSFEEHFDDKIREIVAIASLSITRYLTDHVKALPLGVVNRMVNTCDILIALVPLVHNPPWVRRWKGCIQKFIHNRWQQVDKADRLKITSLDAQVWLALNNLVVDPVFRDKYDFSEHRREQLLSLRRYMNELLFDQLPVLKDLQRAVDELAIGSAAASQKSHLLLEAVPEMRQGMLSGRDWLQIAEKQMQTVFGSAARDTAKQRMQNLLKTFDFMASMEEPEQGQASSSEQLDISALPIKMSSSRKTANGIWALHSEYVFYIDTTKVSDEVAVKDDQGNCVKGKRHRLVSKAAGSGKPLPSKGKVAIVHGSLTAEALLELPAASTKSSAADIPETVWLTVGLLAVDGFALQVRLKKSPSVFERDPQVGEWFVYEPSGGAITLQDEAQLASSRTAHPFPRDGEPNDEDSDSIEALKEGTGTKADEADFTGRGDKRQCDSAKSGLAGSEVPTDSVELDELD